MLWNSFVVCFSMYSIVPMPKVEWTPKGMRYCFCFFPLVGLLIGGAWWGLSLLLQPFSTVFSAILLLLVAIVLSGGIHLDGLLDTCDACFSYADREKKLEILKDPRTGAFGVIGAMSYFLLLFACYYQVLEQGQNLLLFCFIFCISRCVGAMCMLNMKSAKQTGLGATFAKAAGTTANTIVLSVWLVLALVGCFLVNPWMALAFCGVLLIGVPCYLCYVTHVFGGMTGDLTGFLISGLELVLPMVLAIGGVLA